MYKKKKAIIQLVSMNGNILIFASLIMTVASSIGVQFGALVTRYVRGLSVRLALDISVLTSAIGAILKLLSIPLEKGTFSLGIGLEAVTFSGTGLVKIMILVLFIIAVRYRHGQPIPVWIKSLVTNEE